MTCPVCSAPALPLGGACVFCRAPLDSGPDPTGLLDYLAERLPLARTRRGLFGRGLFRRGLFGRGPVSRLEVAAAGRRFRARRRGPALLLEPAVEPAEWCEQLLGALRFEAAGDHELRRTLSRSGWDFSPR